MLKNICLIFSIILLMNSNSFADSITIDQILDKGEIRVGFVSDVPPYGILDKDGKPLAFLNVGTGQDISIKDLSTKIAKATKYQGTIICISHDEKFISKLCNIKLNLEKKDKRSTGVFHYLK